MGEIYKLSIKPKSGLLTGLHSDTIFGHLCFRLKECFGEDALTAFLDCYKQGSPVVTISGGMPENNGVQYFPLPVYDYNYDLKPFDAKKEKIANFLKLKKLKKIKLIPAGKLNSFLQNPSEPLQLNEEDTNNTPFYTYEMRTCVQISRETFRSEDEKLFRLAPMYLKPQSAGLYILIKVIDKEKYLEYEIENLLKSVFTLGYGCKKSSGFGEFEIDGYEEYESLYEAKKPAGFITLSNYLPAETDGIEECSYDFAVKYGVMGEENALSKNPFKKPLIFMLPGSCFRTKTIKPAYGRVTREGEISPAKPEVVQNGFAFSINFEG